jgi:hypothetical protein
MPELIVLAFLQVKMKKMPELLVPAFLHVKLKKINVRTNSSSVFTSKNEKKY